MSVLTGCRLFAFYDWKSGKTRRVCVKRVGVAALVAVVVLSTTAAAILWGRVSAAEEAGGRQRAASVRMAEPDGEISPNRRPPLSPIGCRAETPVIGIAVRDLLPEEAEELGIDGGAFVERVLLGGPSTHLLEHGDIITAIDGVAVSGVTDLIEVVRNATPGESVVITIHREGLTKDIEVTVGERSPHRVLRRRPPLLRAPLLHPFTRLDDLVNAEIVLEGDDGPQIFTLTAGTITSLDVAQDSVTLAPKDGSNEISYNITGNTRILSHGRLGPENKAMVAAKDGNALVVLQGELSGMRRYPPLLGLDVRRLRDLATPDRLIRAQLVLMGRDGPETFTLIAGTIKELDVPGGSMVLEPRDGSGEVSYDITGRTKIISHGEAGTDNKAIVAARGDEALWVLQGDLGPLHPRARFSPTASGHTESPSPRGRETLEELRHCTKEPRHLTIPAENEERIDRLLRGLHLNDLFKDIEALKARERQAQ